MEHEAVLPQKLIDVGKQWLPDIHRQEFDLGVDNDGMAQAVGRMLEHHQLRALDIHLEIIERGGLRNVVETLCFNQFGSPDLAPFRETMDQRQYVGVWLQ